MTTLLTLVALAVAGASLWLVLAERKRSTAIKRRLNRVRDRAGFLENVVRPLYEDKLRRDLEADGVEPRYPVRFRSQHGEDMLLYELFGGKRDGFFIEVGAFDGFSFAVTYPLEAIGWTGLLIEAIPERAEQAARCRPGSRVVQTAVGRKGSSGTVGLTRFIDAGKADELSSYVGQIGGDVSRPRSEKTETIEVPLTTMDALLSEHDGPIDLAVIDVEGGELDLLDGFDLGRFRPRAILIEDHGLSDNSPIGVALKGRGYRDAAWISFNRLMIHESEPELLLRARALTFTPDLGSKPPEPAPDNRSRAMAGV